MTGTDGHHSVTRWARAWSGCALQRHKLLLTAVGAACVAAGILVAVLVPQSEGPAWAMAVAGCLAAGVLLLTRVAVAWLRPSGPPLRPGGGSAL
jgi:peptidoglycan/LPS O-acetylase OafA/YrhL